MATGVLGKPMEYFNHRILNDFRHQWGVPSPSVVGRLARPYRRLRRRNQSELYFWWKPATIRTFAHLLLARRTTPNGVFANKVTWSQQHSVVVASGIDADTWLRAPRYVFLRRRDHLRQAISWVRARQTQSWSSDKPPSSEHRYDRELIARLVVQIEAEEAGWRTYLGGNRAIHEVWYEDLVSDWEGSVGSIFEFLGEPGLAVPAPPIQKQADAETEAWVERYLAGR